MENVAENATSGASTLNLAASTDSVVTLKVYKWRIWILFLFSFLSMLNAMMFVHYTSMANVTGCFYNVSQEAVNWTGMVFMVVYVVLVFPAASLISYMDLRRTVLCASFFNTAAIVMQFATLTPDSFAFVMGSSFLSSIADVFILGIPPFLAAKWFPPNELSRACAIGVFGNQLGSAFGFIFSPLIVTSDCTQTDLISTGKRKIAYILAAANIIVFILIMFTFQSSPDIPPSLSQAQKRSTKEEPFKKAVISMFRNINFDLIFLMYGLMVGSYFALATTLNDLILRYFPHQEVEIGWMGLIFIVAGLIGSIIAGFILDYTKKFKETSLTVCIASLLSLILFSCLLMVDYLWVQFVSIAIYGFFLTSILPIGFEYGLEMTYPLSESVCACLLNASTMIFGIILTEVVSRVRESQGAAWSNAVFGVALFICCVITSFISKDYKRTISNQNTKSVA